MKALVTALTFGLYWSAMSGCSSSDPKASCETPGVKEPPAGCGPARLWVRKPQTSECIVAFSNCVPENTDTEFWMRFSSLVDCQALSCKADETRPAGDGCNTCTCMTTSAPNLEAGYWKCSNKACGDAVPTGEECGFFEGECNAGEFCAFSPVDGCSSTDAPSICITQPTICTAESVPVCGCDGTTYENRCEAARAGTGIREMGRCPDYGNRVVACGSRGGATCEQDEYCAYQAGDLCGAQDAEAVCLRRPAACVDADAPVCGCDGQTYANACEAAKAGTGVLSDGACCSQ